MRWWSLFFSYGYPHVYQLLDEGPSKFRTAYRFGSCVVTAVVFVSFYLEGNSSQNAHRRGLPGDLRVAVRLAGVPVDNKEVSAGRVGVLGGEAARQHRAGLHIKNELGPLAAVLIGEQAGEVGVGGARDPHAGVEPDRAILSGGAGRISSTGGRRG